MRTLLSVILICLVEYGFSQSSCETFRKKSIDPVDTSSFRLFINSLPNCGFDSVDLVIFQPMLPVLAARLLFNDISATHTYGELVDTLRKWTLTNEYKIIKEEVRPCLSLRWKKVILENWKADSAILLNCGFPFGDLDSIHHQILSMSDQMPDLIYAQVMYSYLRRKKAQEDYEKDKKRSEVYEFLCDTPKYASIFSSSNYLPLYFDYNQALDCAKILNKPLFIDFNGWGCVNCKKMEKTVWQDSAVHDLMKNNFVLVSLYVDDRTLLPENEWKQSSALNKMIKTIGDKNFEIEYSKFKSDFQPNYCIVSPDGNQIGLPIGSCNKEDFKLFLQNALKEFQSKK